MEGELRCTRNKHADLLKSMLSKETWYFDEITLKMTHTVLGLKFGVKNTSKDEIEWLL